MRWLWGAALLACGWWAAPGGPRQTGVTQATSTEAAPAVAAASATAHTPAVVRVEGFDAQSGIAYVLLGLGAGDDGTALPRLVAQCTKTQAGRLRFETLVDVTAASGMRFVRPWVRTETELFPPALQHETVAMDFLGYTRVKPMKRVWVWRLEPAGELMYNEPGLDSGNLEPSTYYLQYLRALPTLQLTLKDGRKLKWETTAWQQALLAEPMCGLRR